MTKALLGAVAAIALTAVAFTGTAEAQCWWTKGYNLQCAYPSTYAPAYLYRCFGGGRRSCDCSQGRIGRSGNIRHSADADSGNGRSDIAGERKAACADRRAAHDIARRAARGITPDRDQKGLRSRLLRRLHGACRRAPGQFLPGARGALSGQGDHDDRRLGGKWRAAPRSEEHTSE